MYLDSSALVKLVVREHDSEVLRARVAGVEEPVSSIIAAVEVARAVRRSDPSAVPRVALTLEPVQLIEIDQTILEMAARLDPLELSSADAIHLASALRLASNLSTFITYDRRLHAAASRAGVPVTVPG